MDGSTVRGWRARGRQLGLVVVILIGVAACGPLTPPPTDTQNNGLQLPVRISGLDAHDGTIVQDGSLFRLYGTRYGCGFRWDPGTPTTFCGMGAWHAPSLTGPWTYDGLLFDPSWFDTWSGQSWQRICGTSGWGCFNPRMVKRPSDGTWILWFDAPDTYARTPTNGFYALVCSGPAGPCGSRFDVVRTVAPNNNVVTRWVDGVVKPELHYCTEVGDFSIITDDAGVSWILCTQFDQSLAVERLDETLLGGHPDVIGQDRLVDGATESPGAARVGNGWVYTYADPNCGYCGGTGTTWAVSTNDTDDQGLPTAHATVRGKVSTWSCDGQPRTAFNLDDGSAWQWIDDWLGNDHSHAIGNRTQTGADIVLSPLKTINGILQPLACPPGGS